MKKIIIGIMSIFLLVTSSQAYTDEDWKVYEACKDRVYDNVKNGYDYEACKEMLDHKEALRKYGASSSYDYWIKRLAK